MLRRKPPAPVPTVPTEAICVEGFRPGVIAHEVKRWSRLPLDHPHVQAYPEFFRGLVPLPEGVNDGNTEPGQR